MPIRNIPPKLLFFSIFLAFAPTAVAADTLSLRNGDRLSGSFAGYDGDAFAFDASYGGSVNVPGSSVSGLATDGVVTLRLRRGGYYTGRLIDSAGDAVEIVSDDTGASGRIDLDDIAEMHPGREFPGGLRWKGRLNVGATQRSGNTEAESVHLDGEAIARGEEDRFTARAEFNREIDDGNRTEDDFRLSLQHDHFIAEKSYFYTNGGLERDQPAGLRLRSMVGTGIGYQVLETRTTYLSVELGPSYTNDDYFTAPDNDYVSGRWAVDFRQDVWGDLNFFHRHEGLVDIEDSGGYLFDSSTGFRVPLGDNFNATAQVDYDYDSDPVAGAEKADRAILLTLGYSW